MKQKAIKIVKDTVFTLIVLVMTFTISVVLQDVFNIWEHITTLFVFAVFIISLNTDGYLYGVVSALAAVLAINYAFTYPYFYVDFSAPASVVSAVVMLIIAFFTSMFTTRMKHWQVEKAETDMEHMRANLLRSVSHDLRTPLTTIYGASSSVAENYDKLSDSQKMQMIRGIQEDSQWLIRIVENLLSVTKFDSGNVKLIKTPVVLDELIDSVILKFKKRYPEQPVELDIPEELVLIPMDAILIEQVIINILENAIHHAKDFTRLVLRVFVMNGTAIFEISDNGCGIAKDRLEHIFSGYTTSKTETGDMQKRNAGIGLSVCAAIIKAHGGTITAQNGKEGGAVFRFCLAVEEEDEQ